MYVIDQKPNVSYYIHKPNYNKDMILVCHFSANPPISLMQNIYSAKVCINFEVNISSMYKLLTNHCFCYI